MIFSLECLSDTKRRDLIYADKIFDGKILRLRRVSSTLEQILFAMCIHDWEYLKFLGGYLD